MTHPAPIATTPTRPASTAPGTMPFLNSLYANQCGFIELAWIEGDPDQRETCQFRREWFHTSDVQRLNHRIAVLGRRYGNVYVSVNLYQQPSRNANVLPGRIVFVDDAPLDLDCSFSVRTSPSSKHAYFLLGEDVPADVLRDLARRAAYALGADKGGWDSQQLVRVPGTFNTKAKYGGRFLVALQAESGQTYTVETLRALWPAVAAPSATLASPLNWPAVECWLGNLDALIGENGLPRRVKPTTQTGRILAGVVTGDSSLDRYIVARGLVMHGYPDDEAAALLWHYCEYDKTGEKGSAWLNADIVRVLAKLRVEQPGIVPSPTRYQAMAPAYPRPQVERPRRGRKIALTPEKLHRFYDSDGGAGGMVMRTIAEVAAHFNVSRSTVERCEQVLKSGPNPAIERRLFNQRQSSCVAVLRPVTIQLQPAETAPVYVPSQDSHSPHSNAETAQNTVYGVTHPPDAAPVALGPILPVEPPQAASATAGGCVPPLPASTPPTLRAALAEVFDAAGPGAKVTRKRAVQYLAANYPDLRYSPAALDRVLQILREERQRQSKLAALAGLTLAGLKAQLRLAEHLADKSHATETNEWRWWEFYRAEICTEMKTRPVEQASTKRRLGIVEAVPSPRSAAQAEQQDMLDQIAAQPQPAPVRTPIAVKVEQPELPAFDVQVVVVVAGKPVEQPCNPFAQVQQPATPRYDAPGLAGRLHALKAVATAHYR